MLVSLQWLRELVSGDPEALEPALLAERLSIAGFEVEAIEDLAAQAAGVVVGQVETCDPHPDANKLSVCQVGVGAHDPLQIVCGAPNVRAGIHVPVAMVGTTLSAVNLTIKAAELRGVASRGMICSLQELGLMAPSDGIAILDDLLETVPPLGQPVGPALGLDDQVLELAITANRPDGLSMRGIAREVAAIIGGSTTFPAASAAIASQPLPISAADRSTMEQGGLFSVTELRGLRVSPSPPWLQRRLERAGLRPINNVVDITNLVMLETGQPLHAFDAQALARLLDRSAPPASAPPASVPPASNQPAPDQLASAPSSPSAANPACLGLRPGRAGDRLTTLDGEERLLDHDSLVVTYSDKPIALAGVMGGLNEAVTESTDTVWLEAAVFSAPAVRRSARSAALRTEASNRFEKGLPCEVTLAAADRAVQLLCELAGARVEGRWAHQRPQNPVEALLLRRDALHNLLGPVLVEGQPKDLEDGRIEATLSALGCELQPHEQGWLVGVPASRAMDLRREVDLIEEVARLVGYDHFDSHLPDPIAPGGLKPEQQAERRLRRALCAAGLQEHCTLSLVAAAPGRIPLANPLLADYGHLRDNLHGELLQAARRNLQANQDGFWGFEIGHVFHGTDNASQDPMLLGGVLAGERRSERWSSSGKPQPLDYYRARGALQAALQTLHLPSEDRPLPPDAPGADLLHPGRAAQVLIEGRPAGWFGQLHPARAEDLDLPQLTYVFELQMAQILAAATRRNRWQPTYKPYATVPTSERDLAIVVENHINAAALLSAIRKAGKPLLEKAELVDRYDGAQVREGHCSQAFRLRYRDPNRTLTDEEVERVHQNVRRAVEHQFAAELRS